MPCTPVKKILQLNIYIPLSGQRLICFDLKRKYFVCRITHRSVLRNVRGPYTRLGKDVAAKEDRCHQARHHLYPTGAGLCPVSSLLLIYEPKNHPK